MRQFLLAALLGGAIIAPAGAWDYSDTTGLANILVSEHLCDLVYDQAAIAAWVTANVPDDDIEFPDDLETAMYSTANDVEKMGASQTTAHCTQVRRLAARYGFTP